MSGNDHVAELARLIEGASGNVIPPGHHRFLAEVAARRARARGLPGTVAYVRALASGTLDAEWRDLLPLVTIKESFLFRTPQHFAAITGVVLPELVRRRAATRRLRVWSAGCARGEEPTTLAVVLAEHAGLAGWDWRIDATDVDQDALTAARRGGFGERAVSQVPAELLRRHFRRDGPAWELSPALRDRISYSYLNLVHEPFACPALAYDLILLRNVLIYFGLESQRRVAAAITGVLAADGYLFLGPAETLWQISEDLTPVDLGDCFCYRHRASTLPVDAGSAQGNWKKEASVRGAVGGLRPPAGTSAGGERREPAPAPSAGRGLLRDGEPPGPGPAGTRARLHEAATHLAGGRVTEARELVEQALAVGPSDPEVHALEGLVHDLSGSPQMAVASYRAALFLEPTLFQIRFLLAETLRRLGWRERAAGEYRQVLASLSSGRLCEVDVIAPLALPDREETARRCRQALRR